MATAVTTVHIYVDGTTFITVRKQDDGKTRVQFGGPIGPSVYLDAGAMWNLSEELRRYTELVLDKVTARLVDEAKRQATSKGEAVDHDFKTELKKALDKAKADVTAAVQAEATKVMAETITRMAGVK